MKIVFRVPNWVGDAVLCLPAVKSLHESDPSLQIWIATEDWVKDLFLSLDYIKGIIPLPKVNSLRSIMKAASNLKKHHFNAGLLFTNSFSSALIFTLAGIPQRWGYAQDGRSFLLTKRVKVKKKTSAGHHLYYYLHLISSLGFSPVSPRLHLPLMEEQIKEARALLDSSGIDQKKPLVLLNPGASYGPAKRWPAENFSKLAESLQKENNAEILIIGSQEESHLAEIMASQMKHKPHILTGRTSLSLLAGLISEADLFITNDTGPMHMASALKIPIVALFGPTDPERTGPFQKPFTLIQKKVFCWPCRYRECPTDHKCMTLIESEEVFAACQRYLK